MDFSLNRRQLFAGTALSAGLWAVGRRRVFGEDAPSPQSIAGFDQTRTDVDNSSVWNQTFDRKIRVGLVGFGLCQFGVQFGLQNHPNVELIGVSDLIPERCAQMAKVAGTDRTYPSLEEMVKDDRIEAIFVATDAPSHVKHCVMAMEHGKHVASAVPACFASLEQADQLYETVKKHRGLNYMLFETSTFHDDCYAMRQIYNAGGFGKMVYSEGEYYHFDIEGLPSYNGWRNGLPPQYYPTHSNAYYCCVTGGAFTEVSCMGIPSHLEHAYSTDNQYQNPFGTEIALFRTSEGGMARMGVSWDTPGFNGEMGRVRGQLASYFNTYDGTEESRKIVDGLNLKKPALPPGVEAGGHGGSHGYLGNEFIMSILENRRPLVNIEWALNLSASGIVAHQSAMKDGELMKIPQYPYPHD
ncbi:MAG: Gfo/Idh/MocA family oxidoreductase [Planctomycetia bacterium]|nr:Gfo/Idh/MocA family oxidoreductase [Planctomycetia bacterium]